MSPARACRQLEPVASLSVSLAVAELLQDGRGYFFDGFGG
jgi:hypothetical protein